MPRPPKKLYTDYEKQLLKNILLYSKRIQRLYNNAIIEVSLFSSLVNLDKGNFNLDLYPSIRIKIDQVLRKLQKDVLAILIDSTRDAWDLANKKNDIITKTVLGRKSLSRTVTDEFFHENLSAYRQFIKRKEHGLDLSRRVWNTVKSYRHELEAGIANGIKTGQSAASMASVMRRYLKDPDNLFRRVRDDNGKLQLSRAARAFNPGQGVYRSSFKNAIRLTRTETNMSYRNADYERWQQLPFVLGFEIKLSNNHPRYDICDPLAGAYPKTFRWAGWHPQCICYAVPVLANDKQFNAIEDKILGLSSDDADIDYVKDMPAAFKKYLNENRRRIRGWKNKPYWAKDNPELVKI